jgi:hypothetical protein
MNRACIVILAALLLTACPKGDEDSSAPRVSDFERERSALAAKVNTKSRALKPLGGGAKKAAKPDGAGERGGADFAVVEKEYRYDPAGKRDPFRSFIFAAETQQRDARGPLEQFDLAQLKVVAVVWGTDRP